MRETRYQFTQSPPYSLHDTRVCRIQAEGDAVELSFEDGFFKIGGDCPKVPGKIRVTGVDFDFAAVHILDSVFAPYRKFRGETVSLPDFAGRFYGLRFEVIDEFYGYRKLQLEGELLAPERPPRHMILSIGCFVGDIAYITGEP